MAKGDGNQSLGDFIRSRRTSMGVSLADAAESSDLDPSYWNKLENGHYQNPAPQHLQTIARVLEVPVEDLYGLAGYDIPERLPSFQPYLRAKYNLPQEAVAELERYFELLRNYYDIPKDQPVFPPKPKSDEELPQVDNQEASS
ncbi:MAG: helix-turn-helix transcriptional regulator [Acidimicrobiales bacterium]